MPGIFLEDFSGHFFPTENDGEKIRQENPRKNQAAQNQKSAKNPFCQNPALEFQFLQFWRCRKRVALHKPLDSYRPSSDTFHTGAMLGAIVSQKSFVLVFFLGGGRIAQLSRDMLLKGVSHRCVCVKLSAKGGGRIPYFTVSRIYPYPMVWPLLRPWSETMVSDPL